jgi:hypothetical protein
MRAIDTTAQTSRLSADIPTALLASGLLRQSVEALPMIATRLGTAALVVAALAVTPATSSAEAGQRHNPNAGAQHGQRAQPRGGDNHARESQPQRPPQPQQQPRGTYRQQVEPGAGARPAPPPSYRQPADPSGGRVQPGRQAVPRGSADGYRVPATPGYDSRSQPYRGYEGQRYDNRSQAYRGYDNRRYAYPRAYPRYQPHGYGYHGYAPYAHRPYVPYVLPYGYRPYGYRPGWSFNLYFGHPYAGYYGPAAGYGYYAISPGFAYGSLRIVDAPQNAQVFVDGYYAGVVDDYDGVLQHLNLEPGSHRIELQVPGYGPVTFDVFIQPGQTVTYRANIYY